MLVHNITHKKNQHKNPQTNKKELLFMKISLLNGWKMLPPSRIHWHYIFFFPSFFFPPSSPLLLVICTVKRCLVMNWYQFESVHSCVFPPSQWCRGLWRERKGFSQRWQPTSPGNRWRSTWFICWAEQSAEMKNLCHNKV